MVIPAQARKQARIGQGDRLNVQRQAQEVLPLCQ